MSFKTNYVSDTQKSLFKTYTERVASIRKALVPSDKNDKKLLEQNPDLNLTGDIESKLMYNAKLELALGDPATYYVDKVAKIEELGNLTNAEFARVFKEVSQYASKKEAIEQAEKSAKNVYSLGMHRIQIEYPDKLDDDLERKLLIDLKTKLK